ELLKFLATGYEIAFTIDLDQHAHFTPHVDVRAYRALSRDTARFFTGGRHTLLSEDLDRRILIAVCFDESILAIDNTGARFFTKCFNRTRCNLCHMYNSQNSIKKRSQLPNTRKKATPENL